MFKLAELFVQISGNAAPLHSTLGLVHAQLLSMVGLGGQVGAGIAASVAGPLLGVSAAAATGIGLAVIAAGALTAGLAKAAMMAGHLNEAFNKAEQIFGSSVGQISSLADELADKYGVVKTIVLDTAASFGAQLQGAGAAREEAAKMSATLVRLAADAKSFHDIPLEEALVRMRSGLSGEHEAVRKWGINLLEKNIQNKAKSMGLWNGKGQMDQSAKTMASYQIIVDGLRSAQGDLERTGGNLTQQWEKFTGNVVNLGTVVGSVVVPALTFLLRRLNEVMGAVIYQTKLWAGWVLWLGKASGLLKLLGLDQGDDNRAAARAEIDARIKATEDEFAASEAAAHAGKTQKIFQGGLEEYAKKVAEGAAGQKKDSIPNQQLAIQKQQLGVLQAQLNHSMKGHQAAHAAIAL
jgi:hypothetical protein